MLVYHGWWEAEPQNLTSPIAMDDVQVLVIEHAQLMPERLLGDQ
jgi:hypothetical protein